MQNVSYYLRDAVSDDESNPLSPLQVNCCGVAALSHPFTNHSPQGRNDYYFLYMAEGRLEMHTRGVDASLQPGDLVIIPPQTAFSYSLREGSMAYYWIHFTGALCEELLKSCRLLVCTILHPGLDAQAQEIIGRLHRAFLMRAPCFPAETGALFGVLLARLCRLLEERARPIRLQTSLEYMHRHYAEPLRLHELSAMEYLSPSRFSALFRTLTGLSPQHYLTNLRMQAARELIRSTDMPVKQVAASVGYSDQLYFSRLFRQTYGLPPSRLRLSEKATP